MPNPTGPTVLPTVTPNVAIKPRILFATGGSGGHISPALAIAEQLQAKGFRISFIGYGGAFTQLITERGYTFIKIPAAQWNVRNPVRKLWALLTLARAFLQAFYVIYKDAPAVVVGGGGYASVAAVLAAKVLGVPTAVHEQNVIPGRANRFLFKWVDKILLSFEDTRQYAPVPSDRSVVTGNPVRDIIYTTAQQPEVDDGFYRLLVTGGSQATRLFSEVVPQALALLPVAVRQKLRVVHQARAEDISRLKETYLRADIVAELKPFFTDLPQQLHRCHVNIGRAGASTITEAIIMRRVQILIPGLFADGHQVYNARVLADRNAGVMIHEDLLTPALLAQHLEDLFTKPALRASYQQQLATLVPPVRAAVMAAEVLAHMAQTDLMHLLEAQPDAPAR